MRTAIPALMALALLTAAPAAAEVRPVANVVVDNRAACSASAVGEFYRKRAVKQGRAAAKRLTAQGYVVRLVVLEPGMRQGSVGTTGAERAEVYSATC